MRSNKSGRRSRCTRLRNRRGRRSFPRTTLLGRWQTFQIPFISAMPRLGRFGGTFAAGNTYGNVQGWVNAANTGIGVILGYQAATINVAPAISAIRTTQSSRASGSLQPRPQRAIWAMALLKATSRHWERCEQTPKRGNQTSGSWRLRHTPTIRHSIRTWRPCSESTKQHLCSSGPSKTQIRSRRPQLCSRSSRKSSSKMPQGRVRRCRRISAAVPVLTVAPLTSGYGYDHEPAALKMSISRRGVAMNILDWINQGIDNLTQHRRPRNGRPWFPDLRGAAHDHDGVVWSAGGTVVRPRRTGLQLRKFVDFRGCSRRSLTRSSSSTQRNPRSRLFIQAVHHCWCERSLPTSSVHDGIDQMNQTITRHAEPARGGNRVRR